MSPEISSFPRGVSQAGEAASTQTAVNAIAALEGENARLRGDLRTISRRLVHDLRNPLNGISTALEAIRDTALTRDAMTDHFAQSISDSVDEAGAIVQRLSVVLKATADPVARQIVAMEEVIAATLQRMEPQISKASATIAKPSAWPVVKGVPAWISLIWENFVLNSLQHAGPKPHLEFGSSCAEGGHRFWLRDSGRGIAPEKRPRLFHALERLHEPNAPRGYGLPIVRRLVELQDGHCGYESAPAPGGIFFFALPGGV